MIRPSRCCMCPQTDSNKQICPGIPGTPHPKDTFCDFVKQFRDDRGWTYFVRAGLGQNQFKAFYRKPDKPPGSGEHAYRNIPWRESFDEAQVDLDELAQRKGWTVVS